MPRPLTGIQLTRWRNRAGLNAGLNARLYLPKMNAGLTRWLGFVAATGNDRHELIESGYEAMYGDWENAIYGYDLRLSEQEKAARRKAALKPPTP
jgi:2-hydroxychromene-2-carboxylate isomerase